MAYFAQITGKSFDLMHENLTFYVTKYYPIITICSSDSQP